MNPETVRPKGPRIRTAILVIVLGLILGIGGAVKLGTVFWDVFTGPTYIVPGTVRTHLDSGTYIVFERTSTDGFGSRNGVTIDPREVTVIGPGGAEPDVTESVHTETLDRNSDHFVAAVEFHAPTSGRYAIRFDTGRVRVLIEQPFGDIARDNVGWFLVAGLGWILVLTGVVLFIVGIVRRSSAKRSGNLTYAPVGAAPIGTAPTVAPAGWFPDPHGEHRLRYWDGTTWTEHISD